MTDDVKEDKDIIKKSLDLELSIVVQTWAMSLM